MIGAGTGLTFSIYHYNFIDKKSWNRQVRPIHPSLFELSDQRVIDSGRMLVIAGRATNKSKTPAKDVRVTAHLYDDIGMFGDCFWTTLELKAGETKDYSLVCNNFRSEVAAKVKKVESFVLDAEENGNS